MMLFSRFFECFLRSFTDTREKKTDKKNSLKGSNLIFKYSTMRKMKKGMFVSRRRKIKWNVT